MKNKKIMSHEMRGKIGMLSRWGACREHTQSIRVFRSDLCFLHSMRAEFARATIPDTVHDLIEIFRKTTSKN